MQKEPVPYPPAPRADEVSPGPWRWSDSHGRALVMDNGPGDCVAWAEGDRVMTRTEADARLIAAAPTLKAEHAEMLALLRDVVRRNNFSLPADGLWNLQELAVAANDILVRIDKKEAPR